MKPKTNSESPKRAVQVWLDPDDYSKLSSIALEIGCCKGSVLRVLVREYTKLKLQVTVEKGTN